MIRIYHARILTMQEDQEIFDGEIWISDHKIQYVGPENKEEAAKIAWERRHRVYDTSWRRDLTGIR